MPTPRRASDVILAGARFLRRSKSLTSMVPALWATGLATLLATGLFRLMLAHPGTYHFVHWMENWLVAWPIAFPIGYLGSVPVARRASGAQYSCKPGLGLADVEIASIRATVKNGLAVRRKRARTFEVA